MKRTISRVYLLDERDVCEAIVAWLKARDNPAPGYIATTDKVTWTHGPLDVKIEWHEELEPQ
jgi:hypothetical protein